MCRDGRQYVADVKCGRPFSEPEFRILQRENLLGTIPAGQQAQKTVGGREVTLGTDFDIDHSPRRSYTGIDDSDVDRSWRKPRRRIRQNDSSLPDALWPDAVRKIHEQRLATDREDHAFHLGHI